MFDNNYKLGNGSVSFHAGRYFDLHLSQFHEEEKLSEARKDYIKWAESHLDKFRAEYEGIILRKLNKNTLSATPKEKFKKGPERMKVNSQRSLSRQKDKVIHNNLEYNSIHTP